MLIYLLIRQYYSYLFDELKWVNETQLEELFFRFLSDLIVFVADV